MRRFLANNRFFVPCTERVPSVFAGETTAWKIKELINVAANLCPNTALPFNLIRHGVDVKSRAARAAGQRGCRRQEGGTKSVDNGEADTLSGSKRVCQVEETSP